MNKITVLALFLSFLAFAGENIKPNSRYLYKAEAGAYIEASRKETFSVCPDKGIKGAWISEYSVSLNKDNCISVQMPNLAGTVRILFLGNSGRADTIQVLVEQSYIQMGDYPHKLWVSELAPPCNSSPCRIGEISGRYESREYGQPLIVDKTKFTMGDVQYYSKISGIKLPNFRWDIVYPKSEKLDESQRPYIGNYDFRFANERSKKEGLDTVYHFIDRLNYSSEKIKNLVVLGDTSEFYAPRYFLALDTSASGYGLPSKEEWFFLMRAGANTRYYWGDEDKYWEKKDSLKISRYAWINPIGLKPVAQLLPNSFGLYDMIGIAYEMLQNCAGPECSFMRNIGSFVQYTDMQQAGERCEQKNNNPEYICIKFEEKPILKTEKANFESFRLLRKTPKLQKLEKFSE